jgi:hypothetical protein
MGHKRIFAWAAILALVSVAASPSVSMLAADSSTNTTNSDKTSSVRYQLAINSTEGGLVITPGEGAFNYTAGTVVDLAATPDSSYRFVEWAGDVDTIADVNAASTNVIMDGNYSITANFAGAEAGDVGIKAGDWIKLTYNTTGWPAGQPHPEWLKLEFLSLNGTIANVQATVHISNGSEQSDSGPVDVVSGSEVPGLAGIVISANRTTGDSAYIVGYGNVAIAGEATQAYAGADRTVVYAGFSQNETQVTYNWDKLTGVIVEISSTSPGISGTVKATETNMWETPTVPSSVGMRWWLWIVVGVAAMAAGLAVFFTRRKRTGQVKVQ